MRSKYMNVVYLVIISTLVTLSGCADVSLWPFNKDEKTQNRASRPANATEYQCAAGKKFYERLMDNGNAAWLILSDREVSLPKVSSSSGVRYSNGNSVLNITGNEATLDDGPTNSFNACKALGK